MTTTPTQLVLPFAPRVATPACTFCATEANSLDALLQCAACRAYMCEGCSSGPELDTPATCGWCLEVGAWRDALLDA